VVASVLQPEAWKRTHGAEASLSSSTERELRNCPRDSEMMRCIESANAAHEKERLMDIIANLRDQLQKANSERAALGTPDHASKKVPSASGTIKVNCLHPRQEK
jgi:hypothetical protein